MIPRIRLSKIESREDFATFVDELKAALESGEVPWENRQVPSYLDALAACASSLEGRYANRGETLPDNPTWKMLAELIWAAAIYE